VTERENMDFTVICCQINVLQRRRSVLLSLVHIMLYKWLLKLP